MKPGKVRVFRTIPQGPFPHQRQRHYIRPLWWKDGVPHYGYPMSIVNGKRVSSVPKAEGPV